MLAADTISELHDDIIDAVRSAHRRHGDDPAFSLIAASAFTLAMKEITATCGPKFESTVIKGLQSL
ncbi:hypothetical protein CH337_02895 [Rhodoblastus acidophilus]|nr:hypothetical protein CKO16_03285 [Rhodoblastus acidophilus]RAI23818.1 hypothetical protein CH337_02895 [Rhodoblastus acidophilus]